MLSIERDANISNATHAFCAAHELNELTCANFARMILWRHIRSVTHLDMPAPAPYPIDADLIDRFARVCVPFPSPPHRLNW